MKALFAFVLAAPLLWTGLTTDDDARPDSSPHVAHAARAGSVQGTVTIDKKPPRRRAKRYAGGRVEKARTAQELPAVAYLVGDIAGGSPSSATVMSQSDTSFVPGVLAVHVGESVSFPNEDSFFHNVFSYSKTQRFDLGRFPEGESKSVTFEKPGVVRIYCEVHDFMRAAVVVSENRHHTVIGKDGTFTIPDVPPGTYTLVVWHADLDAVEREVTIPDGGTAEVEVTLR